MNENTSLIPQQRTENNPGHQAVFLFLVYGYAVSCCLIIPLIAILILNL